jgi:Resolvase, N terminal domain
MMGYSGTTLVRPALERLRDLAAAGSFQRLYVHSPDRLARRYAYQVLLVDELRREQVEIVFLNRAIGVSPEEDLLLQMQGMIAEYERAKIIERSRRGKPTMLRMVPGGPAWRRQCAGRRALRLSLPAQDARRRGSISDRSGAGPRRRAAL